jgi:hypothetical protein
LSNLLRRRQGQARQHHQAGQSILAVTTGCALVFWDSIRAEH